MRITDFVFPILTWTPELAVSAWQKVCQQGEPESQQLGWIERREDRKWIHPDLYIEQIEQAFQIGRTHEQPSWVVSYHCRFAIVILATAIQTQHITHHVVKVPIIFYGIELPSWNRTFSWAQKQMQCLNFESHVKTSVDRTSLIFLFSDLLSNLPETIRNNHLDETDETDETIIYIETDETIIYETDETIIYDQLSWRSVLHCKILKTCPPF